MAALGLSMGSCFCVRIHKDIIEAVCSHMELVEFLPSELRRLIFAIVRAQAVRPSPTYVAAVSVLGGNSLEFYFFIGSDAEAFDSVPGLQNIAQGVEDHLRSYFRLVLPEDSHLLLENLTVSWEPNILVITE
ncbi:E4 ORF A [Bat mastadenovirus G]|uniref:E4 ORF A n=1 Tax=Bat mastadenovirus G TaxID=2015376 RepID=A0A1J0FAR7_9ADEN|nr:E4 ORF A [Bat mastadenovirus G]APC26083.1 E4 ORF A [Bat mastadenovirus G]